MHILMITHGKYLLIIKGVVELTAQLILLLDFFLDGIILKKVFFCMCVDLFSFSKPSHQ